MKDTKIYILLTDTGTILTRMIKCYTRKPYNHASIALDKELTEVYSFGRKTVSNPFIGGFVKEDIHSVLFSQANCAIYSLSITNKQLQKMHHYIQEIASEKEKYRYNFLGLFGVALNMEIRRKNAYFCSQFVASVLKESKIIDMEERDLSFVKPTDLIEMANFQLVFEGSLIEYTNKEEPMSFIQCNSLFTNIS